MPVRYKVLTSVPTNNVELVTVLEAIWKRLATTATIDLAVLAFRRRLQACIRADGGHFEHLLKIESVASTNGPFSGPKELKK